MNVSLTELMEKEIEDEGKTPEADQG